jgi:hypothetical protein
MKIEEIESQLQIALSSQLQNLLKPLIPAGYRAYFYLYDKNGRKKPKNAAAENWSPASGKIQIWFYPEEEPVPAATTDRGEHPSAAISQTPAPGESSQHRATPVGPLADLVRALSLAEQRPGFEFVSLKWFRDSALPDSGYEWAMAEGTRQDLLRAAIARRLILTSKVANPKDPQFPVTAIRLNHLMPEVQKILGEAADPAESDFHPVQIAGEPMSATIIRERRQQ